MNYTLITIFIGVVSFHCSKAVTVTETTCTKDAADQCKHTPNAECDNDENNAKCKCSDGFIEDKTDGSTCVKVLGGTCAADGDCTEAGEAGCTDRQCSCKADFGEKDNKCVKTVSGTTCNANGNECNSISNSHCDTDSCKCNDGFVMNVDVCDADTSGKVTETGCTKDAADQCKHTPHAECDNVETGAKCKCSDGYAEDKTDGKTCVKRKVTDTGCTKDAANQCEHTPNAECDNAETGAKCKCSDGYAEDKTDGSTCLKTVSGTTCSENGKECDKIDNSHCDNGKCKCDAGYVMNVDACTAEKSAASIQLGTLTVLLSGLAILIQQF